MSSEEEPVLAEHTPEPVVSQASLQFDMPTDRGEAPPPDPAASVTRRIEEEKARARTVPLRPTLIRALVIGVAAAVIAAGLVLLVPATTVLEVVIAAVVAFAGGVALTGRTGLAAWYGYDPALRALRAQARDEQHAADQLAPLTSAGWVILHDRLIAAHRVPTVLIGPPGVVCVYPYGFPAGAGFRYQRRHARAVVRNTAAAVAVLPLALARMRPAPTMSVTLRQVTVQPSAEAQGTVAWGCGELRAQLSRRPGLDSWTVLVYAQYAVVRRPPDRRVTTLHRIGVYDAGTAQRTVLETGLPAGLNRAAIAHLAAEVDDTCPPA